MIAAVGSQSVFKAVTALQRTIVGMAAQILRVVPTFHNHATLLSAHAEVMVTKSFNR